MSKASLKLLATGAVMAVTVVLLYTSGQEQPEVNNQQTIELQQQPLVSSSQNFFPEQQKEQPIRAKVAPWSHDLTSWRQNTTLCSYPEVDTPSVLKTPGGPVKMSVYDPRKDIWVSRKIVNGGDFDGNKRQLVYSLLERDPDINFIDVGCNIGVYSLTMAKLGRKVLCVDALYMNVEHVCSSIVQNNFENSITIVMNALSNDRKYVELGVDDKNYGGTFVDEDAGDVKKKKGRTVTGGHYTSIPSVMMDDLLQLPVINMFNKSFIKMDIEGFEWKALQGASAFFSAIDVRGVFMEWIFHKGKDSGVKITEFMVRHNLYPHAQVTLTTYRPLDVSLWGNWHFMDILWLKR